MAFSFCVYVYMNLSIPRGEKDIGFFGNGVIGSCEPPLELNLDLREEQCALLNTEPSVQPQGYLLISRFFFLTFL